MHSTDSASDTGELWIPSYKKKSVGGGKKERDEGAIQPTDNQLELPTIKCLVEGFLVHRWQTTICVILFRLMHNLFHSLNGAVSCRPISPLASTCSTNCPHSSEEKRVYLHCLL